MNNIREAQKREDMLLELYKFHAYIPNDAMGDPLTPFGNFCEGWQAATEQSQKEIAELEAQRNHWQNMAGKFANDEFIALEKLTQASLEIEALQAREKVLVEALQNLVEDISKTHGNYTYEQAWINADEALVNVINEKKG